MKHPWRQIILVSQILSMLCLSLASSAHAQTPAKLEHLNVELWPEFDRPSAVLVLLEAKLAASSVLPATVKLPMPAAAGIPHAVAKRGSDGQLYVADFTREVKGDTAEITVQTDSLDFRLEYYVPIDTTTAARKHVFSWPGNVDVTTMDYAAQVPRDATGYTVVPASTKQEMGTNGLNYHFGSVGAVPMGKVATIAISYSRSGSAPSAGAMPPPPPSAVAPPPPTPGFAPTPTAPPEAESKGGPTWFVVIVIGILVLVVGVWLGRSSQQDETESK